MVSLSNCLYKIGASRQPFLAPWLAGMAGVGPRTLVLTFKNVSISNVFSMCLMQNGVAHFRHRCSEAIK